VTNKTEEQAQKTSPITNLNVGLAFLSILPPAPPTPRGGKKVELRFADVIVQNVDPAGKVTISMQE
jgi:hypothetical protein